MMMKILSIMLLISSIGVFIFGSSLADQAAQGERKVSEAEENAQEHRRPIVGPVRKGVRAEASESAEKKIGEAEQKIVKSQVTANWLHGTAIALFVAGIGCMIFSFSSKKRD